MSSEFVGTGRKRFVSSQPLFVSSGKRGLAGWDKRQRRRTCGGGGGHAAAAGCCRHSRVPPHTAPVSLRSANQMRGSMKGLRVPASRHLQSASLQARGAPCRSLRSGIPTSSLKCERLCTGANAAMAKTSRISLLCGGRRAMGAVTNYRASASVLELFGESDWRSIHCQKKCRFFKTFARNLSSLWL